MLKYNFQKEKKNHSTYMKNAYSKILYNSLIKNKSCKMLWPVQIVLGKLSVYLQRMGKLQLLSGMSENA